MVVSCSDGTLTMPSVRRRRVTLAAVLVLFGCASEDAERDPVRASEGSRIASLSRCTDVGTAPEPRFVLGGMGAASDSLVFERLVDAAPLPEGGILLADSRAHELVVVGPNGSVHGVFGGKGDGPGEFISSIQSVHVRVDTVLVYESSGRISAFDPDGGFRARSRLRSSGAASVLGFSPAGHALVHSNTGFAPGAPMRDTGRVDVLSRANGEVVSSIGPFLGTERYSDLAVGFSVLLVPFGHRSSTDYWADEELVSLAVSDSAVVAIHRPDGTRVGMVPVPGEARPVTDEMTEAWLVENAGAAGESLLRDHELPDSVPPYASVAFDDMGLLWVQRYPMPGDDRRTYSVVRLDGEVLEELTFEDRAELLFADEERVVLRTTDDLGIHRAVVFDRTCTAG